MSSFSIQKLLDKGLDRVNLPLNDPTSTYDKLLNAGSLINSGISTYKKITSESVLLKKFIDNYDLVNNPGKTWYFVNSILRDNPVRLPVNRNIRLNLKELNELKVILLKMAEVNSSLFQGHETATVDQTYLKKLLGGDGYEKINNLQFIANPKTQRNYMNVSTPYTEYVNKSPREAYENVKDKLKANPSGYKYWNGFELGTTGLWDISLKPYRSNGIEPIAPEFPSYILPYASNDLSSGGTGFAVFNLGEQPPIQSYTFQFGSAVTSSIDYYSGNVRYLSGFEYNSYVTLDFVDDVNMSLTKYFNKYINSVYDLSNNARAVYSEAAFELKLVIFKPGYLVNYEYQLIVIPYQITPQLEGDETLKNITISIDCSIIGMIPPNDRFINEVGSDWEKSTKWRDVLLQPLVKSD